VAKNPNRVAAGRRASKKGSQWERDAAVILSEWSGKTFKRVPRSGALRWGGIYWTYGDLIPPEGCLLVVECKHHADVRFSDVLGTRLTAPGEGRISQWWYDEAVADARRATQETGRTTQAMLLWKRDHCRARLTLDLQFFNLIGVHGLVTVATGIPGNRPYVTVPLSSFLEQVSFEELVSRIKVSPSF